MRGKNYWGNDSSKFSDEDYRQRLRSQCILDSNGCWLWQGFRFKNGYGDMSYRCKNWRVQQSAIDRLQRRIAEIAPEFS